MGKMKATLGDSIHFNDWHDMVPFGINALTGEACAYSMRLLCDLSEEGCLLMQDYLGLPALTKFANPWNSMVGDAPAVASVMLDRFAFERLAEFICMREGVLAVVLRPGTRTLFGVFDRKLMTHYEALVKEHGFKDYVIVRNYRNVTQQPSVGSRNVHAFTGRAV